MSTDVFAGSGHPDGEGLGLSSDADPTSQPEPLALQSSGLPPDVAAGVQEMQRQLHYAAMVRANYEKQLQQLATALQSERVGKGESSLRVHELMQEVQDLQHVRRELHDQVEHWRYRAQETMEQKAADVMRTDSRNQGSPTATEEILLDIKKLQESEAYWRQQASTLKNEYEEAENDVCNMIRELQHEREVSRSKEASEKRMRDEIEYLQKALRSIASSRNSQSSEYSAEIGMQKSSGRNDGSTSAPRPSPHQDGGHSYLHWQTPQNADAASVCSDSSQLQTVGPAQHGTHNANVGVIAIHKPTMARAAPPHSIPNEQYGYENPTMHGALQGSSDVERMYASYASTRSQNNQLSPAINPSTTQKLPDYNKVVQLQMELLQMGRYEEAEKLSLQFSADDVSVNQMEDILSEFHSSETHRSTIIHSSRKILGPSSVVHSLDEADPLKASDFQSAVEPIVHRHVVPNATRATAPPISQPRSASSASDAPGFSAIGEASVQVLEPYQQPQHRRLPLQIHDLQEQGSPAPQRTPQVAAMPRPDLPRTRSTEPPMHEKLALENKLASLAAVQKMPKPPDTSESWIMRVNVIQANLVPWKNGVEECCCCLSLLQASANISSRSFHSIQHVQAGRNISPLAVVDGALEITAMDRTSLVDTEKRTVFNQTVSLTEMHPAAVHVAGDTSPSAQDLEAQDLDGRPALLFVSIHTVDGQGVSQAGRTAVLIQGKGLHSQSFTLLHSNGTPVLSRAGHPATIQLRYCYLPASEAEDPDMLHAMQVPEKAAPSRPQTRSHSKRSSASPSRKSVESSPQISATLGFFNTANGSADHSDGSSERNSTRSIVAVDGAIEADMIAKPRVTVTRPPSNLRSAPRGSKPEPSAGAEVASHTSMSLATSQSSTRDQGLATSQSSISIASERHSPKLSPVGASRKVGKTRAEDRNNPLDGSDNMLDLVEMVHIVRRSSNDNSAAKSRVGIGISFGVTRTGETFITGLSDRGQAKASGKVKEGDQLLAVDGVSIKGWQVSDIVQAILGKPGTKVRLDIIPELAQMTTAAPSVGDPLPPVQVKEPGPTAVAVRAAPPTKQPSFKAPPPPRQLDFEAPTNQLSKDHHPEMQAQPATTMTPHKVSQAGVEASPIGAELNGTMTQAQWARRQLAKMGDGFSKQGGIILHPKKG